MKRKIIYTLMAVMLLVWAGPATADTLYGVTQLDRSSNTPSYLYTISSDLITYTNLGQILGTSNRLLNIQDIAYNPVDNKMYGINKRTLFTLDIQNIVANTIAATLVTNQGLSSTDYLRGLTVAPDGTIYAASSKTATASGDLFKYDSVGNTWVKVGSFGISGGASDYMGCTGDLDFDSSGILYGSVTWVNHKPSLVSVDTNAGTATPIGAFGTINIPNKTTVTNDGLAFWGTTLYGTFASNLGTYTIDPSTGSVATASFHATGINFNGLTLAPIPGAVLLLGTGLTCLAMLGLRKKS